MIISLNELIEMCVDLTNGTIPVKTLMEEYHLRFNDNGFSSPVNDISLDTTNKAIEMSFNKEKILDGIDDGDIFYNVGDVDD